MGRGGGRGEWAPASPQSGWCFVEAAISRQSRKGYRWKDHADVGAIWILREVSCVILSSLTLVRNLKPLSPCFLKPVIGAPLHGF